MSSCKSSANPVEAKPKVSASGSPFADPTLYRSLAGELQYLTFTRPDISYVVQQVCLHIHDPKETHMADLKRIIRYVQGTLDHGLHLYPSSISTLVSYTDADWVQHQRTKHIEMDILFVREKVARGKVRVLHVPSRHQVADIFTKGLPRVLFEDFRDTLSVRPPPALTKGVC
ncbi:uncharacterized protein LOC110713726 [Chenopodium quinoa]|uniref:uncharacterized protein LOC110713726 n=1 Tax=Chenopodium quinoa TaxID=63459 RepID=UPI000B76F790|nr:uncharacterized protein LOC110713726 [Chenopodium quinoa]